MSNAVYAEVDFGVGISACTNDDIDAEVAAWVRDFAPSSVAARVINYRGPGGGNPVVFLYAPDVSTLRQALIVLCGGDEESADYLITGE